MAAIAVTAASVVWASGPVESVVAGEAFTAGAVLYKSAATTWLKAQNDGTTVEAGEFGLGIALFTADAASARGQVALPGAEVTFNAALIAGGVYFIHGTAGGFTLTLADVGSGARMSLVGLGLSTTRMYVLGVYRAGSVLA